MEFKIAPIEVPAEDPFRFDALKRKPSIEALTNLVNALKGPFVLTIDSPWGTGKTTFIKIWQAFLESQGFACLYFNAWETDFSTDPLVAFLSEFGSLEKSLDLKHETFSNFFNKAKKIATVLAKKTLPIAGKIATGGLLDLDEFSTKALADLVSETIKDAVDAYTAEKELIRQFHEVLTKAIGALEEKGKKDQLIVFVDEIDRCRPTFAVELLERIKHLFNVDNAIFILALDKHQIAVSLKAIYGEGLDTNEYLRRFLNLEYSLPKIDTTAFSKNLFDRFGFEAFFAERTHSEFRYDKEFLFKTFNALSDLLQLSLRAREQCFTQISVAMMTTPSDHYFHPILITTLIVLKAGAPEIYRQYAFDSGLASEVMQHLLSLNGGLEFLYTHPGKLIESYLIAAKSGLRYDMPDLEYYKKILSDQSAGDKEKERADVIIKIIDQIRMEDRIPQFDSIVNKIELAAQFNQ
jgi:hypothetical protein